MARLERIDMSLAEVEQALQEIPEHASDFPGEYPSFNTEFKIGELVDAELPEGTDPAVSRKICDAVMEHFDKVADAWEKVLDEARGVNRGQVMHMLITWQQVNSSIKEKS